MPNVSKKEQAVFFRQLGVVYAAGVPFFESLTAIETRLTNQTLKAAVKAISQDVERGIPFHLALKKFPKLFSPLVIAMVEAGEKGGMLGEVFKKIHAYLDRELILQGEIRGALRYPVIAMVSFILAFIVAVIFIIPKFSGIFSSFGAQLPLPTRILLGVNFVAVNYWWLVIILGAGLWHWYKAYHETPSGRRQLDRLALKVPVFGELIIRVSLARIFYMLSTLVNGGISIIAGMDIAASASDNVEISEAMRKIQGEVLGGAKLADAMAGFSFFPPLAIQMISTGEKSGSLDEMFQKCAEYFNEEADSMVANLTSLIEPFMIFFLAMLVVLLALGIYLPMWSLTSVLAN